MQMLNFLGYTAAQSKFLASVKDVQSIYSVWTQNGSVYTSGLENEDLGRIKDVAVYLLIFPSCCLSLTMSSLERAFIKREHPAATYY